MQRTLITWVLALAAFASIVSAFMLAPLLKDIGAEFGVSDSAVGQLTTMQAIIASVVALLAAPMLDRYPRRAALRFQLIFLSASTVMTALAPDFGWLLASRVLAGIGGGMIISISLAAVSDIFSDPDERNRRIGLVLSAASVAPIVGTPLVAQMNDLAGWRWAAGITAVLPLLAVAGTVWLPSTASTQPSAPFWSDYRARISQVAASRETTWLLAGQIAVLAAWGGFEVYVAAYLETDFAARANAVSLAFALAGISFLLATNLTPRLIARWPKRPMHAICLAILTLNFAAVGVIYVSLPSAMVFVVVIALMIGCAYTITSILLIESLPSARGAVMALQSAANNAGVALGAAWGGIALAGFGNYSATYRSLGLLLPIAALCLLMSVRAVRRKDAQAAPAEAIELEPAIS
jgi:predicted MFS family arabinose efflux permease